jgi:dihydroflavonol-4-reductase
MDVPVAGGTGFIGSHTAKALKQVGPHVRVLTRSEHKADSVFKAIAVDVEEIMVGDVTDPVAVARAIRGCDAVIHSAAMISTVDRHAEEMREINVAATSIAIDGSLAAGIKNIIYVSSLSALFNAGDTVMNKDTPVSVAKAPTLASKWSANTMCANCKHGARPSSARTQSAWLVRVIRACSNHILVSNCLLACSLLQVVPAYGC